MRDRRLQRRARDARDAPPPPPDARGEDPPAGPGSNHDHDDFSASDADAALPSRAPRGGGADTTARAGSARVDAFSPHDDDRAETETAEAYDAALRGLEADRRALREEVLRVRRADREREEAASFERARRLELEREVAQLRGGGDERATKPEAEEGVKADDDSSAEVKRLTRALAEERRARKIDAELRGELETVAARLAEAVALADETDRAARREMASVVSAARRDARRASLAETEALRFERRAEDAESNCATLLERARLAERRLENGLAAVSLADDEVTKTKTKTKDEKETRVTDGERDVSDESLSAALENSLRAELVGVREDLKRETTLAKSALRDLDDANFARDEAMSLLRQKERDLESLKESLKAAKAEETAILDAAREEASRDLKKCYDELAEARAASDDLNARLADALLDLDEVSSEKKRLAEALALEARETRDARDEAERLARQLADERESSRRRLREARAVADAKEAKHRLEQAEWEDAARLKRRERYAGETRASFSAGGPDRDPTGRDPTGRDPTVPRARTGEGADGVGDGGGGGDASKPEDARQSSADRAPVPPRSERGSRSRDDVLRAGSNPREGEGEEKRRGPSSSRADPDRPPPRARPAYAPNGFPLPTAEASAPVSFAPPSSSARGPERTVPVPVPVPGASEYDRYLESLPPSPIAGPPPPPPPGRTRGRGDAREEPAPRFWRERPVRSR
jgi:hypothetical protein